MPESTPPPGFPGYPSEKEGSLEAYLDWALTRGTSLAQSWHTSQLFFTQIFTIIAEINAYLAKYDSDIPWIAPSTFGQPAQKYFYPVQDWAWSSFLIEFAAGYHRYDPKTGQKLVAYYVSPFYDVQNYPLYIVKPITKVAVMLGFGWGQGKTRTKWKAVGPGGATDTIFRRSE